MRAIACRLRPTYAIETRTFRFAWRTLGREWRRNRRYHRNAILRRCRGWGRRFVTTRPENARAKYEHGGDAYTGTDAPHTGPLPPQRQRRPKRRAVAGRRNLRGRRVLCRDLRRARHGIGLRAPLGEDQSGIEGIARFGGGGEP